MKIGTPLTETATKVLFCGSGELGKEVVIEFQRLGVEVIALDRYENAPAMQVAHRSYVLSMLDGKSLRKIIEKEKPDYIVPEIEAIATDTLADLESEGYNVIPCARATVLTMNREGIRRLAAETLAVKTSPYFFAETYEEFTQTLKERMERTQIGFPFVIKPIMSSSGKGQSVVKKESELQAAWTTAIEGGRVGGKDGKGKVIVEGFINFDYEITLLTVRHRAPAKSPRNTKGNTATETGEVMTSFCEPIGHVQIDGDYRESWQPHPMSQKALDESRRIAKVITDDLGGLGVFGVELFVRGDEVYFSEVSPRPHDTGLVTLVSQDLSEFALHARAILGLPIPKIELYGPSASSVLLVENSAENRVDQKNESESKTISPVYGDLQTALAEPGVHLRLFGKPGVEGKRRMGVVCARGATIEEARAKAKRGSSAIKVEL